MQLLPRLQVLDAQCMPLTCMVIPQNRTADMHGITSEPNTAGVHGIHANTILAGSAAMQAHSISAERIPQATFLYRLHISRLIVVYWVVDS